MIPHDAAEPVGVVVEDPYGRRIGLVADLGCRTSLAWGRLHDLDVLILETNHDLDMLRNGPYPWSLKQRVAGRHGHLSNREAAEGLPELVGRPPALGRPLPPLPHQQPARPGRRRDRRGARPGGLPRADGGHRAGPPDALAGGYST